MAISKDELKFYQQLPYKKWPLILLIGIAASLIASAIWDTVNQFLTSKLQLPIYISLLLLTLPLLILLWVLLFQRPYIKHLESELKSKTSQVNTKDQILERKKATDEI